MKQIKKLLEYFNQFELTDILAFGKILEVEEIEPFEDYITEICVAFSKQSARKRKQLLQLAEDVAGANKEIKDSQESQEALKD